ncbi:MAG: hypothetical protein HOW73_45355 [Polyangiaceae bacterium]|nr:hypothetical protein [Polyangiaceae bacterium]
MSRAIAMLLGAMVAAAPFSALAAEPDGDEEIEEETDLRPADAETWSDPDLDVDYPQRSHLSFRAVGGGGLRAVHSTLIGGAEAELSLGADTKRGSFLGSLHVFGGRTEGGLPVGHFTFGPTLAWQLGLVSIGPKLRIGYFWIDRVTSDDPIDALTVGGAAALTVDLHRNEGFAVALNGELRADALLPFFEIFDDQGTTGLWGASLGLQIRLRAPRRTPPRTASVQ